MLKGQGYYKRHRQVHQQETAAHMHAVLHTRTDNFVVGHGERGNWCGNRAVGLIAVP
jgi:hypothetical protein